MAANALIQTRIDRAIKDEATAVLAAMGLTVSDAVRLLLTKVSQEKALPFEPLIPNAATIAAMREARAGNLNRANTVEELMVALYVNVRHHRIYSPLSKCHDISQNSWHCP